MTKTTLLFGMALALLGCDPDGLSLARPDADSPDAGTLDSGHEVKLPPPAPIPPSPVPIPPRPAPVPPPEAPIPPPPAPMVPPPAPIPVPPEGCPCGTELAQHCDDGLCYVFDVCSVCRE